MSQSATSERPTVENPLLEGLRLERSPEPFAMVIFGAHGDLTKRKLLPALYALYQEAHLPKNFAILATSRTVMDDEQFRNSMKDAMSEFAGDLNLTDELWSKFAEKLYYRPANTSDLKGFEDINSRLSELDTKHGTLGNHIFYLSTPPSLYSDIVSGLAKVGLATKCKPNQAPWPRIIVEKPFGHDLASSKALDEQIHEVFNEHQVFRIDHYLGKETVQNIMVLRFANGIFEPLWNREHVEHIQITNAETLGVEGRGTYYEEAGALRDMIQNHLLQLVSLVGMEPPTSLAAEATRDEKVKVLRALRPIGTNDVGKFVVRGQYSSGYILGQSVPGYREEQGVSKESVTETFAAIKLHIDNWRWEGVPIFIRSGKRLAKSITEIAIHFKRAPHLLFDEKIIGETDSAGLSPNVLVLRIQPDEGVSLKFATKQPGQTTRLRWLSMDFKYGTAFGGRTPSAYERLVHDCLLGDPALFSRTDQVEVSWAFISPILEAWSKQNKSSNAPPLFPYAAGSWGPEESNELIASEGFQWRRL